MTGGRTRYGQALTEFDPALIVASLSDDVTIRVAVHDELLRGKDTAGFLFGVLTEELTPFEQVEEIVEENNAGAERDLRQSQGLVTAYRDGSSTRTRCSDPI